MAINEGLLICNPVTVDNAEPDNKGLRIARYCTLEELPALVFGVMTVAYIVLSLAKLAL
jgi:hypothetical protein